MMFRTLKYFKYFNFRQNAYNSYKTRKNLNLQKLYHSNVSLHRFSKKPLNVNVILISGVMSFLGFKDEEKEPELITTIKRGILLIQKEEFKKAEQMLHIALKIAQDQQNYDGVTYVYDVLANLAFDVGEFAKAENLFVTVMQRLLTLNVEPNDNKMLHISLKLAKMFELRSDFEKAEQGYKFCLDNLESKVNNDGDKSDDTILLWGMSLDMYAHFLLGKGRIKEAFECFKRAYDMCVEINGREHEQTVILLNDLGTVANIMGNNDSAISYLEEAVEIGTKLPEMKDLGPIYVNLGQVYLLKEMFLQSKSACEKGKLLARKHEDKEEEADADKCLKEISMVFSR